MVASFESLLRVSITQFYVVVPQSCLTKPLASAIAGRANQ